MGSSFLLSKDTASLQQHYNNNNKVVCGLALAYGASAFPDGAHGGHHAAASSGYDQPAAPSSGYDQPAAYNDYGSAPAYGAEEAPFDISTLIIPLLIIAGLSLLFPTITTVDVRKKRHAADVNPMTDVVERVNDIYSAVVQSEECMERIACEIGGLAADVGL